MKKVVLINLELRTIQHFKERVKMVKTDTINARRLRTAQDGNLSLLKGFEFNINGKLGATLFTPFSITFDRVAEMTL